MSKHTRTEPELSTPQSMADELVRRFTDSSDRPGDHRCTTTSTAPLTRYDGTPMLNAAGGQVALSGLPVCDHVSHRPLLARLEALLIPGTGLPRESSGGGGKKRAGSPAPWTVPVAELLDEIRRDVVRLDEWARDVLGFEALTTQLVVTVAPFAPTVMRRPLNTLGPDYAARVAMLDLVQLVDPIRSREPSHSLVHGGYAAGGRAKPGIIEKAVRGWHTRATHLTGHTRPWARLGQVPNPVTERTIGPACSITRCQHDTCAAVRAGRPRSWVMARCPHCQASSLRQNPSSGAIECMRPSCVDLEGKRHRWSADELRRLGLILQSEIEPAEVVAYRSESDAVPVR